MEMESKRKDIEKTVTASLAAGVAARIASSASNSASSQVQHAISVVAELSLRNEINMVKESMKEINDKLQKIIEKT